MHAKLVNTHCARGGCCRGKPRMWMHGGRRTWCNCVERGQLWWLPVSEGGGLRQRSDFRNDVSESRNLEISARPRELRDGVSCILPTASWTASIKLWEVEDKSTLSRSYFRASPGTSSRSLPT